MLFLLSQDKCRFFDMRLCILSLWHDSYIKCSEHDLFFIDSEHELRRYIGNELSSIIRNRDHRPLGLNATSKKCESIAQTVNYFIISVLKLESFLIQFL